MVRNINVNIDLSFSLSYEIFGWLNILGFPVNLSGDWLFPNRKRWKLSTAQVVGEGESSSWEGTWTKVKGRECKPTKKMFLKRGLLKLRQKEKHNTAEFFPDKTVCLWLEHSRCEVIG